MKVKVVFVLPSLTAGGAERVMSFLATHLNRENFNSELLITGYNENVAYDLENRIPITFLNKANVRRALPKIALFLIRHKPNIVIGAIGHVNLALAIMAIFFRKIKFVGRETIVTSTLNKLENKENKISLIPNLSPLTLSRIICQSEDMKKDLIEKFGYPKHKLITINNPVTSKFRLKEVKRKDSILNLITVGRLTKQKGYIRILDALSKLDQQFKYIIIGDGPEKTNIFSHARRLNLIKNITHIPFTNEVELYLSQSDLFLSGSYVEGFPNVFLESCAVGTPVLAFTAPGGINEIILDGINGYIANDENNFYEKLLICASKKWDSQIIRDSVYSRYSEKSILQKYESLFLELSETIVKK